MQFELPNLDVRGLILKEHHSNFDPDIYSMEGNVFGWSLGQCKALDALSAATCQLSVKLNTVILE